MRFSFAPVLLLALASAAAAEDAVTLAWKLAEGDELELHMFWDAQLGGADKFSLKRDFKGTLRVQKPADDGAPLLVLEFLGFEGSNTKDGKATGIDADEQDVADQRVKLKVLPSGRLAYAPKQNSPPYQWRSAIGPQFETLTPELPAAAVKPGDTWSVETEGEKSTWTFKELTAAGVAVLSGKHVNTKYELTGESSAEFDVKAGNLVRVTKTTSFNPASPTKVTRTVEIGRKAGALPKDPGTGEKSLVVRDDFWGFSWDTQGLDESSNETPRLCAFEAALDAEGRYTLRVDQEISGSKAAAALATSIRNQASQGYKADPVVETTVAGLKAHRVVLRKPDGAAVLLVKTDAEPGQPHWSFLCRVGGDLAPKQLELADAAIGSFSLFKGGEIPKPEPDLLVCPRLACSIRTAGFKGKAGVLPWAFLGGRHLTGNDAEVLGTLTIYLRNTIDADRAAAIQTFRKTHESDTSKVLEAQEIEFSGRKAVRIRSEWTSGTETHHEQTLIVWDGDITWEVRTSYSGTPAQEAAAGKALGRALDSFKLLKEPSK